MPRLRFPRSIPLLATVLVLAINALVGLAIWQDRDIRVAAALGEVSAQADVLAVMTRQYLGLVDDILLELGDSLQRCVTRDELRRQMISRHRHAPYLMDLVVMDAQGDVYEWTTDGERPRLQDREYFLHHLADGAAARYVGPLQTSRVHDGRLFFAVARRGIDANGKTVVIAAMVDVGLLQAGFHEMAGTRPEIAVVLAHNGMVFFRLPAAPEWTGRFHPLLASPEAADLTFEGVSRVSGEAIFSASRAVSDSQFVVAATLPVTVGLAGWYARRFWGVAFAVVATTAIVLVSLLLIRQRRALELARRKAEATAATYRQAMLDLERSNEDLEQFAYVASHDLRAPLRTIGSFIALLERRHGDLLPEEAREYITFAREGAMRMDLLVLDLLEYSRIGRAKQPLAPVDSGQVLMVALTDLQAGISQAGCDIRVTTNMPVVAADREELLRLFSNLLGNAVKYRRADRPCVIEISAVREADHWHLMIADNGIGIATEYRERVFGVFQRLHAVGAYEGTGIGLAICRRIIEHHGGRIWVDAGPQGGSAFHFTLKGAENVLLAEQSGQATP